MTLPASGAITLGDVNTELGLSATAQIGMNDAAVRSLLWKSSGAISLSDGYGKAYGRITAGVTGTAVGYDQGGFYVSVAIGSSTQHSINGADIAAIVDENTDINFVIVIKGNRAQSFWTSLIINGVQYDSASASSFSYDGPTDATSWFFNNVAGLVNGSSYNVYIK